ncbi:MAG: hypothetical protein JSW55_13750, partial [Chloroflexota bacterium]
LAPVEFVELNFDFHPRWIRQELVRAEFCPERMLTVSHYRLPVIKKIAPVSLLVRMDSVAQWSGDWWQLTPSVFVSSESPAGGAPAEPGTFFACPECGSTLNEPTGGVLACPEPACGRGWRLQDGLYDFKEPL